MKKFLLLLALSSNAVADVEADKMLTEAVNKYHLPLVENVTDNVTDWGHEPEVWQPKPVYRQLPSCKYGYDIFGGCRIKPKAKAKPLTKKVVSAEQKVKKVSRS